MISKIGAVLMLLVGVVALLDWMMAGFPFALFGQSVQTLELWLGLVFTLSGAGNLLESD